MTWLQNEFLMFAKSLVNRVGWEFWNLHMKFDHLQALDFLCVDAYLFLKKKLSQVWLDKITLFENHVISTSAKLLENWY